MVLRPARGQAAASSWTLGCGRNGEHGSLAPHRAALSLRGSHTVHSRSAAGSGVIEEHFGDWQMRCWEPAGLWADNAPHPERGRRRPVRTVLLVNRAADRGPKSHLLRVIAPSKPACCPRGLGLKVDQTDIGRAGFVRCLASGCVAEVGMVENLSASSRPARPQPSTSSRRGQGMALCPQRLHAPVGSA